MYPVIIVSLVSVFVLVFFVIVFQILILRKKIDAQEQKIITLYREKIDKIPAFIEMMRKYTPYNDIFLELTHLHKIAIISNISSVYDILEINSRIHREFLFLMQVSTKIHNLNRDGNFLYIRDFITFYEDQMNKEFLYFGTNIDHYNSLLNKKNLTIIGILFPWKRYDGV